MKKLFALLVGVVLALSLFAGVAVAEGVYPSQHDGFITVEDGDNTFVYVHSEVTSELPYGTRLAFVFILREKGKIIDYRIVDKDSRGQVFFINANSKRNFYPVFKFKTVNFDRADQHQIGVKSLDKSGTFNSIDGYDFYSQSPYFVEPPLHGIYGAQEIDGVMVRKVSTYADIQNPFDFKIGVLVCVTVRDFETNQIICEDYFESNLNHHVDLEVGEKKHISIDSYFEDECFGKGEVCAEIIYWGYYL